MTFRTAGQQGTWTRARAAVAALALLAPGGPAGAAPQAPASPEPPVFTVQTSTVVVDVVVRDKKGKLVRDLAAGDFEVYEDNVRQTLDSFRVVDNGPPADEAEEPAAAAGAAPAATQATPPPAPKASTAPTVVAFLFDRMSPNARGMAQSTAMTYVDHGHTPGDLAGVFSVDLALRTLQPFTEDLEAVRTGLRLAGTQANTAFASEREKARDRAEAVTRSDDALQSLQGQTGAGASAQAAVIASQQVVDQAQVDMIRAFDVLEREQQGFATTHGLLAMVNGLKAIPGRKTIVFFSEGLALPTNVMDQFHSVIAAANRANVAIYAVDAGGLRIDSGTKEMRDEVLLNARRRLRQEETAGLGIPTREALTRGMERNEDMLRISPESGLGQLATDTGGFLVRDTNDARASFKRITEEMRFHYLLSYAPTNDRFDGTFRTIGVKVKRPDLKVQTRKGYLAVRPVESPIPVRTFEAPALAQLDQNPRPDAFPLHAIALSFPEGARPGLAPVLVEVPGSAIEWTTEAAGGRAEFAVLVRIKDRNGREADRMSQEYRLSAPKDKLEAARRGDILFYREAELPPGRYTAEAVAYDATAKSASVRAIALEVPPVDEERLRLSSLVLVDRVEKLTAQEQGSKNPLHFGEAILYPNMGTPFRKSAMPAVGFFFAVYGKNAAAARTASIEVDQGARVVAKTSSELPAPDASGRIQHAGALPLKGFPPGSYTLKVSVSDGRTTDTRDTSFTVEE